MKNTWRTFDFLDTEDVKKLYDREVLTYSNKHNEYLIGWVSWSNDNEWVCENDTTVLTHISHFQFLKEPDSVVVVDDLFDYHQGSITDINVDARELLSINLMEGVQAFHLLLSNAEYYEKFLNPDTVDLIKIKINEIDSIKDLIYNELNIDGLDEDRERL